MKKTTLFLLFSLSLFSATARVFTVRGTLNGASVVPAQEHEYTGTMSGTFDDLTGVLNFTIVHDIENDAPYDYIFNTGAVGTHGTFIQSYSSSANTYSNSLILPNIPNVIAGNIYIEVIGVLRTIRGQLIIGMEVFNNAAQNNFYGLGGYSHTDGYIPDFGHKSPFVWTGPSPQNDFAYVATTPNGTDLYGSLGRLSTFVFNTAITLTFKGNNVRKLGLKVYEEDFSGALTNGSINATITTNLGNTATLTSTNGARFVGFRVLNQDEYIVSATFSANAGLFTSLDEIMFGDDSPKNVALNFDGVDDYVEIPSSVGNFATGQDFTVSCWIKPDATQPTSAVNPSKNDIISKWAGTGSGVNNNYPFVIRYLNSTNANPNKILVGQWDGTTFTTVTSTAILNAEKWYHVAFVRGATGFSLYIDGILQGTAVADNVTGTTTNTTPLQIGRRGNGQNYFKGEIDEVRIWNIGKTAIQIDDEKFCKTPLIANLVAFYNFNNGVSHDNNALIAQVNEASNSANNGTLNGFAKTGDASNFVTGQVKYVKKPAFGNLSGSSWANAIIELQFTLNNYSCNDLFDVYVSANTYKPGPPFASLTVSFNIPTGMRIYGGFAGTEKSINQRNLALIHSTNKTTLSGDLNGNDTPFNFTTNRTDNSKYPVNITGSNVVFDGFTVSGSSAIGAGILSNGTNATIKNSRMIDNSSLGLNIFGGGNATIANCSIMGNKIRGININNSTASIKESLIANNGFRGIYILVDNGTRQTTITNSTIASHADFGIDVVTLGGTSTNTLKNTLIYDNAVGGINSDNSGGGTISNTITYSLVQGDAGGTNGNLNGNTVNPQFVSPLANTVISDAGDYRLKWCSLAINAGNNTGISPLDLDRNPRNFNGNTDMGAYEFLGNTPSQLPTSTIWSTIDSPTYTGGAIQTITSTAKILAPAGAIDFKAPNSIILNPGFEARGVGKYFKAEIVANVGCVNN